MKRSSGDNASEGSDGTAQRGEPGGLGWTGSRQQETIRNWERLGPTKKALPKRCSWESFYIYLGVSLYLVHRYSANIVLNSRRFDSTHPLSEVGKRLSVRWLRKLVWPSQTQDCQTPEIATSVQELTINITFSWPLIFLKRRLANHFMLHWRQEMYYPYMVLWTARVKFHSFSGCNLIADCWLWQWPHQNASNSFTNTTPILWPPPTLRDHNTTDHLCPDWRWHALDLLRESRRWHIQCDHRHDHGGLWSRGYYQHPGKAGVPWWWVRRSQQSLFRFVFPEIVVLIFEVTFLDSSLQILKCFRTSNTSKLTQHPVSLRYLCGFFFWLDAGSTVTLILDLTYAGV